MSALRPLARLAARDARHHPWRSALIVLLIALPVAGFVFAMIGMRTVPDTAPELRAKLIGSADALVQVQPDRASAVTARLRAAGFEVTEWRRSAGVVRRDHADGVGRMNVGLEAIDPKAPLTRGIWRLRAGRVPATPGEVMLTPAAATRLGVREGDRVTLEEARRSFLVTGIAVAPSLSVRQMVGVGLADGFPPGNSAPTDLLVGGVGTGAEGRRVLDDATAGGGVIQSIVWDDVRAESVSADARALLYMLGSLGLMAFGLVVASAMAVGARRQLRVLGLLGAAGASPRQRSGSMLLHGGALGLVGVAAGVPGGMLAWLATRGAVEDRVGERVGATVVGAGDIVLIAVLALAVAVGASLLPARVAAHTSVLQALGGRRPSPRVRRRVPVAGLAVSAAGLTLLAYGLNNRPDSGVPLVATAGIALAVIGMTVTVPFLIGLLEHAAGGLRGTGRLAVRDVARHRGRTGPVVAAVMATGALAIAAGVVALSADEDDAGATFTDPRTVVLNVSDPGAGGPGVPSALPDCDRLPGLAEPVARVLPGATVACTELLTEGVSVPLRVVRPGDLAALGLEAHRADLAAGRVLALTAPGATAAPDPPVVTTTAGALRPEVVAVRVSGTFAALAAGGYLADAATAERWLPRSRATETAVVYRLPAPLGPAQRVALNALADDLGVNLERDTTLSAFLTFDSREGFRVGRLVYWVVLPVALLLSVLVVLVGLALVASDGRDERTTLVAVGAAPGHRRTMQAVRAFVLAGMGQALAFPVGLACAWVILRSQDIRLFTPWPLVAALLVALPVLAAAMGAALVPRDVPALPRRGT